MIRNGIDEAEAASGSQKTELLNELITEIQNRAEESGNGTKMHKLADTLQELAEAS